MDFIGPDSSDNPLTRLATTYEAGREHLTPEIMARLLAVIRDWRRGLAAFALQVERDYIETAGQQKLVVEGLGEVQIRRDVSRRAWDNDGLTQVVVARALDERILNDVTGEYESAFQAVARVLSECARPSWRLGPLRARGIDPDEFSVGEDRGWKVILP